jgi:acyl carrier protein
MRQATDPCPEALLPTPATRPFTSEDDAHLRDTLKRFPLSTREAACEFRRTGRPEQLPAIVDGLRLIEDLAIDSLTMLEIVFLAEDVLQISIDNEELRPFRTVGDVKRFIASKLGHGGAQQAGT